jgi:hypothetical protein
MVAMDYGIPLLTTLVWFVDRLLRRREGWRIGTACTTTARFTT